MKQRITKASCGSGSVCTPATPKRGITAWLLGVALSEAVALAAPAPTTAISRAMFKERPDQATVITATFLGGKATEWLVGGGWQADGSIVLVGNVLGPTLELGAPVSIVGTDATPPAQADPPKVELGDRGRPFPVWNLPGATGFVARCTPDLKKVISVHRLPWTSGTITAAVVDKAGAVYVAGVATENTAKLGGRQGPPRCAR
jgi:hypothetical protein